MYFPDREKPVKKHWMSVLCKSWLYIMQSDQTQTELVENMTARIFGTGSYLPEEYVDNHSLSLKVDTSDEWIRTRTGLSLIHIFCAGLRGSVHTPVQAGVRADCTSCKSVCGSVCPDSGVCGRAGDFQGLRSDQASEINS